MARLVNCCFSLKKHAAWLVAARYMHPQMAPLQCFPDAAMSPGFPEATNYANPMLHIVACSQTSSGQ